ncbi:MAG: ABC transporter permease [Fidelibacterota bacterium]
MIPLIQNELIKISSKWRSYIGFAVIAIFMPLILWGFSVGGGHIEREMTEQLSDTFIIVGSVFNGFLATYIVMNFLWVHIPLLVMLVSGEVVAGEGAAGTFRIYLTRPVPRWKIILAKLLATYVYTALLIGFFVLMSLGLGTLWLGTGDLMVVHKGILILPPGTAWGRFAVSFFLATGTMWVVATLCFMFSTMVNNGIGPVIGAFAILIIGLAIANIPLELFETIRPYLFTSYLDIWKKAFHDPIPWQSIGRDGAVLGLYALFFVGVSFGVFMRKDILT